MLPLNFGPLNGAGGERRLNVAITRARKQVILFSSFDPKDIDLGRSGARGMRDLRRYMEFAAARARPPGRCRRIGVTPHVAAGRRVGGRAGRELGYEVGTGIGLSSFKVDLAVRKPGDEAGRLAVMVDGPEWASRPTVADRDGSPQLLVDMMKWPPWSGSGCRAGCATERARIARIRDAVERAPDAPERRAPRCRSRHRSRRPEPLPAPTPVPTARPDAPGESGSIHAGRRHRHRRANRARQHADGGARDPAIHRWRSWRRRGRPGSTGSRSIIARRFGMRRIGAQKRDEIEAIVRANATITGERRVRLAERTSILRPGRAFAGTRSLGSCP